MPSPFPGMDPFIEEQEWTDFHATFVALLAEMLGPRLEPRCPRYAFHLNPATTNP